MAVSRATGYTNLPNDNFIPEIYSQKVQSFSELLRLLKILQTPTTLEKLKILVTR